MRHAVDFSGWVNGYYQAGYQNVDSYVDEWGVVWRTVEYITRYGKGKYTEPFGHPLADDAALEATSRPIHTAPSFMWKPSV